MDLHQKYTYNFPTSIRFGAGVVEEMPVHLKEMKLSRPLVVTDPVVKTLPFFEEILGKLVQSGLSPAVFAEVSKNPVKSDVLRGDEAYKAAGCDCIIGLGGGVAMDVARAIALRINHRRDLFDYDDLLDGWKYVTDAVPYFVTVPTNAGTGSEVGRSTVISEDDTHKKRVLFAPQLMAKKVFADPFLTMDLPPKVTASTGLDALAHNVEAFLSKGYHPMSDGIALEGIRMIGESLEKAVFDPDLESRSKMMLASLMGAVAFQKGLGMVHSLAHPLSTLVDAHHGTAIGLMFPYGMRFNAPGLTDKFSRVTTALGLQDEGLFTVADYLSGLLPKFGLPEKLSEIGVTPGHIPQLVELAASDFCLPSNPKPVSKEELEGIYKEAM